MNRHEFLRMTIGAALLPPLGACLDGPTRPGSSDPGDPRLTARPGAATGSPELGVNPLALGTTRDGLLYVPASYDSDLPTPLLVALHGAGGDAGNWSGFYDACDARGLLLLAVDSRGTTWDRVRGSFGRDVSFLDRALARTFELCNVDPERIALGGFSDGASYALSLGPNNGDLFRQLIAFSPGHAAPTEDLVGSPRIFVSHGTDDAILSVANTRNTIVPALEGAGYDVTYVEFTGGHEVPREIGSQSLDWFLDPWFPSPPTSTIPV